jgi:hypothetical protein
MEDKRLFDIFEKVNNVKLKKNIINEDVIHGESNEIGLPIDKKVSIIKEFIKYSAKELNFTEKIPKVDLSLNKTEAKTNKSFAYFKPNEREIRVVIANRNLADVLRSLGHELVHYKQLLEGKIKEDSGNTGSTEENEANAVSGVLMRNFGKLYPEIFE